MRQPSWVVIVGLLLLAYGGCCLRNSSIVREQADRVPRMTCDQLVQNGPGTHPYVTLADVRLCTGGYVFRRDGMDGNLDELCQPVYSAGLGQEPKPSKLTLLLRITDDRDRERLIGQPGVVEFTCGVYRGVGQIDPGIVTGLEKKYPGIRPADCWVLTVGNLEPTVSRARSIRWDGIVALLIGGVVLLGCVVWYGATLFRTANTGEVHSRVDLGGHT
jgi:hypothetical protein